MNSKKAWFLLLPSLILILIFNAQCRTNTDPITREQLIIQTVYKQSQQYHYAPAKIDDEFSKKAFKDFIDNMDAGKRFLTKKDLKALDKYETLLDNYFIEGNLEFLNKFEEIIQKLGELHLERRRHHGLVREAVPLLAQRGDAGLQMGEILAGFFKHLFELRALVGLPGELPLEVGGKPVGLFEIVLQRFVVRQKIGGGLRVHHAGRLVGRFGQFSHIRVRAL